MAGVLCSVGGEGVCSELLPYITGGIEGNLERDSGEVDSQLTQKLSQSSPSSSPESGLSESKRERVCFVYVCIIIMIAHCVWLCVVVHTV